MEIETIEKLDIELFEKEILEQRNLLSTDRLDMSFGEIMNMYEREEIIIRPAFQRYFRWDLEQQTRFIESILLGIPIPPIFVAEDGEGIWELVDGLQRISTVLSFFGILRTEDEGLRNKNNWTLLEGDRVPTLAGFSNETLPNKYRLSIKRSACRIEIIRWNSNYDMRFELFNRLNTGGSSLTPQEIRNAIYRGKTIKLYDSLDMFTNLPLFKELTNLSDKQLSELYDQELILHFYSLYKFDLDSIKDNMTQHITSFVEKIIDNENFEYDLYQNTFLRVLKLLGPIGSEAFKGNNRGFSPSIYQALTIGIARNIQHYESLSVIEIKDKINQLKRDDDFKKYSGSGSSSKTRMVNRLKFALKILEK